MSHKIFAISDFHFSHHNMAIKRGFADINEHDEYIIKMYNSVVRKKDTVYILGDVAMEKSHPYKLLDRLNGIKNIVLGNHDERNHVPELLNHVNSVCGMIRLKKCWLTHCPIHPNQLGHDQLNIHGHIHSNNISDERYINVCVENVDYIPQDINEILEKYGTNLNQDLSYSQLSINRKHNPLSKTNVIY